MRNPLKMKAGFKNCRISGIEGSRVNRVKRRFENRRDYNISTAAERCAGMSEVYFLEELYVRCEGI
jgi:hypothetical protein